MAKSEGEAGKTITWPDQGPCQPLGEKGFNPSVSSGDKHQESDSPIPYGQDPQTGSQQ
ncbi:MAG: hypothetical protein WCJ37_01800 [Syntrophus sp. (in: bacteria)]